jgi:hypothetical protein
LQKKTDQEKSSPPSDDDELLNNIFSQVKGPVNDALTKLQKTYAADCMKSKKFIQNIGGPEGLLLTRAAFAVILKLSGQLDTFESFKDAVEDNDVGETM